MTTQKPFIGLLESDEFSIDIYDAISTDHGKKLARKLISEDHQVLEETENYKLIRIGDHVAGKIACIDTNQGILSIYCEYETIDLPNFGDTVEFHLWREFIGGYPNEFMKFLVHKFFLKEWDTVVSGKTILETGRRFWQMALSESYHEYDKTVGVINNTSAEIRIFEHVPNASLAVSSWLRGIKDYNTALALEKYRYFITNIKNLRNVKRNVKQ